MKKIRVAINVVIASSLVVWVIVAIGYYLCLNRYSLPQSSYDEAKGLCGKSWGILALIALAGLSVLILTDKFLAYLMRRKGLLDDHIRSEENIDQNSKKAAFMKHLTNYFSFYVKASYYSLLLIMPIMLSFFLMGFGTGIVQTAGIYLFFGTIAIGIIWGLIFRFVEWKYFFRIFRYLLAKITNNQ